MLRVLELGGFAAGYCGRLYAHAGAEVVRVELANVNAPPGWVSQRASDLFLHSGKRRLHLDDLNLLRKLADQADVIVAEAPTADAARALGLHEWQTKVRVAITPFGLSGPAQNWQATPDMMQDPHIAAREFFVPLEATGDGTMLPVPGLPLKMHGLDADSWTPCPKIGADNEDVLTRWLGYSSTEVTQLFDAGVLRDSPSS